MRKNEMLSIVTVFLLACSLTLSACSSGSPEASEALETETVSLSGAAETDSRPETEESSDAAEAAGDETENVTETAAETAASEVSETNLSSETSTEGTPEESLQNMLMAMDALMMCATEEGKDYDPSDPEFFWAALYRELSIYSNASSLITASEDGGIQVPRQTVQEFATGLFAAYSDLPEIPDALSAFIRYDESWDAYILAPGDRGLSAPEILSASETEDGGYDVTARLYDVTDSSDICVYRFHLVPNAYADGITDPLFLYSVESMSPLE